MFPLVSCTIKTCKLFLYHFIQKFEANIYILKILKFLQGFQVKI